MHRKFILAQIVCLIFLAAAAVEASQVEWKVSQTLTSTQPSLDMAVSGDGKYIYILTAKGTVEVFGAEGGKIDTLDVGSGYDRIQAGQRNSILYLQNAGDGAVKILNLDFILDIDVAGSPIQGPASAPVTIAVFSEFQ